MKGSIQARQGSPPVLSLTAGVADPEGAWCLISRLLLLWAATKSGGKAYHYSGVHGNSTKTGRAPSHQRWQVPGAVPGYVLTRSVDEFEFVVYLLFFVLYLFVSSVGLVFSQGVPHVADKEVLSAPLATEPQAPSR